MRLGAPITLDSFDPQDWVSAVKAAGYRAAYCPVKADAGLDLIRAYEKAGFRPVEKLLGRTGDDVLILQFDPKANEIS